MVKSAIIGTAIGAFVIGIAIGFFIPSDSDTQEVTQMTVQQEKIGYDIETLTIGSVSYTHLRAHET